MIQVLSGTNAGRELPLTKSLTTLGKPGDARSRSSHRPHGSCAITYVGGEFSRSSSERSTPRRPRRDHDIGIGSRASDRFFLRA